MRRTQSTIAGLKMEGPRVKEMETSVLQQQETEFCQKPGRAWKQILPQGPHKGMLSCGYLDFNPEKPAKLPDFSPTETSR